MTGSEGHVYDENRKVNYHQRAQRQEPRCLQRKCQRCDFLIKARIKREDAAVRGSSENVLAGACYFSNFSNEAATFPSWNPCLRAADRVPLPNVRHGAGLYYTVVPHTLKASCQGWHRVATSGVRPRRASQRTLMLCRYGTDPCAWIGLPATEPTRDVMCCSPIPSGDGRGVSETGQKVKHSQGGRMTWQPCEDI